MTSATAYVQLFDGLRGYYCSRRNGAKQPGFQAAMSLSFLCGVNIACVALIVPFALGRNDIVESIFANRLLALPIGAAVAYAHVVWAKRTGRYNSNGPAVHAAWGRTLAVYVTITTLLVVVALTMTAINRSTF